MGFDTCNIITLKDLEFSLNDLEKSGAGIAALYSDVINADNLKFLNNTSKDKQGGGIHLETCKKIEMNKLNF